MKNVLQWLLPDLNTSAIIILSVLLVFCLFIVIVRISGLRTFAKMTSFDFATTIAIGSILATISIDTKTSVGNGLVALATIVAFQSIFAFIQRKSNVFKKIATNTPRLLMLNGEIDYQALKEVNMDKSELMAKLREANVLQFANVKAVVFESTGDVSVIHSSDETKELQNEILDFIN